MNSHPLYRAMLGMLVALHFVATYSFSQNFTGTVFTFGASTVSTTAPLTKHLAGFDAGAAAGPNNFRVVIPHAGILKNLYWYASTSTLTGSNHKIAVLKNGNVTALGATWNATTTTGKNIDSSASVVAGDVVSVRIQFPTGATGSLTRPTVSFELVVPGAQPGDMYYWNGSDWVFIPIGTHGQTLTACNGIPRWGPCTPILTTTVAIPSGDYSTGNIASSGGNITNDGGSPVTARGVCWVATPRTDPTITDRKTINGTGVGVYTSTLTGLTVGTTYHVRAYATNSAGTAYGNDTSFTVPIAIGYSYQGGIIAYILKNGDLGYDATVPHGLIAAPSDQTINILEGWGCRYTLIRAYGTAIGTGNQNTMDIVAGCTGQNAARLCSDLVLGGYSDWFLPSKDELFALWVNRVALGFLSPSYGGAYWCSTEIDSQTAWHLFNLDGSFAPDNKDEDGSAVRAIRSF